MGEINVVPYIDVMLVLLIIFMVTAPLLTQGVQVELPDADAKPIDPELLKDREPLVLSVDRDGRYYLNIGGDEDSPVAEAEVAIGLDIEVLSRAEHTSSTARVHLDAFADVAARFATSSDRPTLSGFLSWLDAAREQERGLDAGHVESDADAVQVLTVHARQGVNADVLEKLAKDSPLGEVLAAGLRNEKSPRHVMKEAIEEAGRSSAHNLERYLTTLGTIATAAPLLGLFGTVVGMIEIFGSQSPTGGTNPAQLAHGISIALYNTAFGIAIAIPALIFYRHFRNKVDTLVVEMEQLAAKLIDIVHGERMDFQPQPRA